MHLELNSTAVPTPLAIGRRSSSIDDCAHLSQLPLKSKGGNHSLELGAGISPLFVSVDGSVESGSFFEKFGESATAAILTGTLGYRYEPHAGGFQFRIGLNPQYLLVDNSETLTLPYMSLGGSFWSSQRPTSRLPICRLLFSTV